MNNKNIQYIVDNALCTACGGCSGICPVAAITMGTNTAGYIHPSIDLKQCIQCGKCCQVCPSVISNTPKLDDMDIFHGEYIEGYVGYATNNEIRQETQSGGIVTALLCYLLDKNEIDGAIINQFDTESKRSKVVYEDNKEGIRKGAGSYYTQSSVVNEVLKHQDKRTAAVVLGCQSESINLIKSKYPKTKLPEYLIGLICAGQYSGNYIDQIIMEAGCNKNEVTNFRFRDKNAGGWPGNTKITTKNNDYILGKKVRQIIKPVYEVHRCLLCFDQMNIFSDITVGDPWGIDEKTELAGNTVVIARTQKGKELIENAYRDGAIRVEKLPVDNIILGQTVDNRLKTQFFTSTNLTIKNGNPVPFNLDNFHNIKYEKPTESKKKLITSRLKYSREIYKEKDTIKYTTMVNAATSLVKKSWKRQNRMIFLIRCFRYALRKLKIKK